MYTGNMQFYSEQAIYVNPRVFKVLHEESIAYL